MKKIRWKVFLPPWILSFHFPLCGPDCRHIFPAHRKGENRRGGRRLWRSHRLGQGVLLLSGGIENYSNDALKSGAFLWFISTVTIMIMFMVSASTGIDRGIQKLSNLGGFPDAFLMAVFMASWIKILKIYKKGERK